VALQQNPDCLSPHLGHQLALDGFFDNQAHRPTRSPFRRWTANHGNNALLLGTVENLAGSRSLLVVEGGIQAATVVAVGDLTDRFGSQGKRLRDFRRGAASGKLAQHECSEDDTHLLNATSQQFNNPGKILRLDFDRDRVASHALQ